MAAERESLIEADCSTLSNNDFKGEKELQAYIIGSLSLFCVDVLNDQLISWHEEMNIPSETQNRRAPRPRRVDLYIQCKKHNYIVEIKNPKHVADNRRGIGQLLDYGREFIDPIKKMMLITTKFDVNTAKTIDHYGLPITYVYVDRNKALIYNHGNNKNWAPPEVGV